MSIDIQQTEKILIHFGDVCFVSINISAFSRENYFFLGNIGIHFIPFDANFSINKQREKMMHNFQNKNFQPKKENLSVHQVHEMSNSITFAVSVFDFACVLLSMRVYRHIGEVYRFLNLIAIPFQSIFKSNIGF